MTINIDNLTLNFGAKNFVVGKPVVLWDSQSLVLDLSHDVSKIYQELLFAENETFQFRKKLVEYQTKISNSLAKNQAVNDFAKMQSDININLERLQNLESKVITEIKVVTDHGNSLILLENLGAEELKKLNQFINSVERFILNARILEKNVIEAELSLNTVEREINNAQKIADQISVALSDIEATQDVVESRLKTSLERSKPALRDLLKMRILSYNMLLELKKLEKDLYKVETYIMATQFILDEYDAKRAYLARAILRLSEMVSVLEQRLNHALERYYALICKVITLLEDVGSLTLIAEEVAVYISAMTKLINQGLLRAGENIMIEYTNSGFAIVHTNFQPYPERPPASRKCIKLPPIKVNIPAPPCPPILPPCKEEKKEEPKKEEPKKDKDSCKVHFSGLLMGKTYVKDWVSVAYKDDECSNIVSDGEYPSNQKAFPKAVATTFDGIAIAPGTRLILYEKQNFEGKVFLDKEGPAIFIHNKYKTAKQYKDLLSDTSWSAYPKNVRHEVSMAGWDNGSCKIICS